ncbi:MAG TPA: DUF998 domain-containing protein [Stenotrophomonas sp.]|nr:DUF998 domain-containing protein [Stenotrophomonas sp.]
MSSSELSELPALPVWAVRSGAIAAAAGCTFVAWVVVLQLLRGDLTWTTAQLSLYLHGPYGLSLRVAYCLLALAIVGLAFGVRASAAPGARSVTVTGLFCAAALGLATVAIGDSYLPQYAPNAALGIHLLAAQGAFLCVIAAILLQSWRFRRDPRWQRLAAPAGWLGVVAFAVLFAHAVLRIGPRGLGQKSAIVLIVAWLVLVGLYLARGAQAASSRQSRDNASEPTCENR